MSFLFAFALSIAPVDPVCHVIDGDTLRCGDERIRLTGIDAPELHGCRRGRRCVPGDGKASKAELRRAMAHGKLRIIRLGRDRYGRTLAVVYAGKVNLACHQLRTGQAFYIAKWDEKGMVKRDCR